MIARKTMIITCNLGHQHEIEIPDDLISIADAAKLVDRAPQTIMTNIATGNLIGYPANHLALNYRNRKHRLPKTMISQSELIKLYPTVAQAS